MSRQVYEQADPPPRLDARRCLSREILRGSEAGSYLRLIDFCITQLKVIKKKKKNPAGSPQELSAVVTSPSQPVSRPL